MGDYYVNWEDFNDGGIVDYLQAIITGWVSRYFSEDDSFCKREVKASLFLFVLPLIRRFIDVV